MSFVLLFIVFIAQVIISVNSVAQVQKNNDLTEIQSIAKDTIANIRYYHEREDRILKQWASGLETPLGEVNKHKSDFNIYDGILDSYYNFIPTILNEITTLGADDILKLEEGQAIYANLTNTLKPNFLSYAEENIFNIPSLFVLTSIENSLQLIKTETNRLYRSIFTYYLFRNATTLTSYQIQDGELFNTGQNFRSQFSTVEEINDETYNHYLDADGLMNPMISLFRAAGGNIMTLLPLSTNATELTVPVWEQIQSNFEVMESNVNNVHSIVDSLIVFTRDLKDSLKENVERASADIDNLINSELDKFKQWATDGQIILIELSNDVEALQRIILGITAFIGIVVLFVVNYLITQQIIEPIEIIATWSNYIADGDLTKTRRGSGRTDEVGILESNFRNMNASLRGIIQDVHDINSLIVLTAEDLSSNTEEINATAEEVSAIAQSMATGSTQQAEIITTIVEELQEANHVVDSVINQITNNLSIVKDLSEQTNVLALNTAIEAANAGDFGRGFTVIAENIRKMSDQSSRTAKIITKDSKEVLKQLQTSFQIITEKIENVAAVSEETAASAEEVAASAEEMTATMESIAAKSTMLSDQSIASMDSVSKFVLTEDDLIEKSDIVGYEDTPKGLEVDQNLVINKDFDAGIIPVPDRSAVDVPTPKTESEEGGKQDTEDLKEKVMDESELNKDEVSSEETNSAESGDEDEYPDYNDVDDEYPAVIAPGIDTTEKSEEKEEEKNETEE